MSEYRDEKIARRAEQMIKTIHEEFLVEGINAITRNRRRYGDVKRGQESWKKLRDEIHELYSVIELTKEN